MELTICGHKITGDEYALRMLLDTFCFYLKEQGIKGLGKDHIDAGFLASDKVLMAVTKILNDTKKD